MNELVKQLWKGFLAIMFGGGLGVGVWVDGGVQFGRAWSTLAIYCAAAVLITFFLVFLVERIIRIIRWTRRQKFIRWLIQKVRESKMMQSLHKRTAAKVQKISKGINGATNGARKRFMHRLVQGLLNAPPWMIFVAYAIPFVPFIGEAAVVVAKIRVGKREFRTYWVLPAFFALTALKAWLTCIVWYHRFS